MRFPIARVRHRPDPGRPPSTDHRQPLDRPFDVERLRRHFDFPRLGRVVTNNAASTQPPRELTTLYAELTADYENVHRGQSDASMLTTQRFEACYDTMAEWLNAPGRRNIVLCRNTTEAINTVMYSLLTDFADGDNLVTTLLEHNSNYVPWHGLARELLPPFGRRVELRLARFDHRTGELDLDHLASLVDQRTKIICCSGASNFLGSKPPIARVREIADTSGYVQPDGSRRSLLLIDGAQLVPTTAVDVTRTDVDYLAFSCHKLLAPFGVGVLYAKEDLLSRARPFLYGGDMIAEGQVFPDAVSYNQLPWKYAAGTPNILGAIVSGQALRLLVDLVAEATGRSSGPTRWFGSARPLPHPVVEHTMAAVAEHTRALTCYALERIQRLPGVTVYGPPIGVDRSPLIAFTVAGRTPFETAAALNGLGVESRAGCHCATLAHHELDLDPPASCRLSFAAYTSFEDVDRAVDALGRIIGATRRAGHRTIV
jgi:cysteine desulfurase/selenocysteine lyase